MDQYVQLAKDTVEAYIGRNKTINLPEYLPKELYSKKAGVFVTLFNNGDLRGCIGTFEPTKKNIGLEIINNAISAATHDYRFPPITENELSDLNYEVSILSSPEKINDLSELNPNIYGVLVKRNGKSGLLLPDLEGIDTAEKQVSIACQKADIDYPSKDVEVYKFSVEKHG